VVLGVLRAVRDPAMTAKKASMMSGIVITGGDSCGWPWYLFLPKKVTSTILVMNIPVMKAVSTPAPYRTMLPES
jgi:hypothetical protein